MAEMDETRLLVKLARMYYQQDMTQAQIAARVSMSRQKVQRLLRKSRETGVVHILIRPAAGAFPDLERALEDRYDLKDAVIADVDNGAGQAQATQAAAAAAAEYLTRAFRSRDRIVVAWGGNVHHTIEALYHHPRPAVRDISVIQGFGGLGDTSDEEHIAFLTQRLAAWFGVPGRMMPAPALAGTVQARKAFCGDPSISSVLESARHANLLITGIGSPASAIRCARALKSTHPELSGMPVARAAGDINLRFFDEKGQVVPSDFDDRMIGLSLRDLKAIDTVVAVAAGAKKLRPILAALRGHLVNVLVTDHAVAIRLLETPR